MSVAPIVTPSIPGSPRRILVTDASPRVADLYAAAIRTHLPALMVHACAPSDESFAQGVLGADLAVCSLPSESASVLDSLAQVLLLRPGLDVLALTPADRPEASDLAVMAGACAVLTRCAGLLDQLPVAVRGILVMQERRRDTAERQSRLLLTLDELRSENRSLQALVDRLESLATTDPLTGLGNRRALTTRLEELFSLSTRRADELSCLSIDLDGLKRVNDTLGHDAGDDLLSAAADVLRETCRKADFAARIGGDEFVALLPHASITTAAGVAGRVQRAFGARTLEIQERLNRCVPTVTARVRRSRATPSPIDTRSDSPIGLSIGVSSLATSGAASPESLLARADAALNAAKHAGRGRVEIDRGGSAVSVIGARRVA